MHVSVVVSRHLCVSVLAANTPNKSVSAPCISTIDRSCCWYLNLMQVLALLVPMCVKMSPLHLQMHSEKLYILIENHLFWY